MHGYNAQATVSPLAPGGETTGMLITAVDMVDEGHDYARLTPMMEQAEEVTGVRVPMTLADAGYFGSRHLDESHRKGQQAAMPEQRGAWGKAQTTRINSATMQPPTATPALMDRD